jgi:hypothetical protein
LDIWSQTILLIYLSFNFGEFDKDGSLSWRDEGEGDGEGDDNLDNRSLCFLIFFGIS